MKKIVVFLIFLCLIGLSIAQSEFLIDNQLGIDDKLSALNTTETKGKTLEFSRWLETRDLYQNWNNQFLSGFENLLILNDSKAYPVKVDLRTISNIGLTNFELLKMAEFSLIRLTAISSATNFKIVSERPSFLKTSRSEALEFSLETDKRVLPKSWQFTSGRGIAIKCGSSIDPPGLV